MMKGAKPGSLFNHPKVADLLGHTFIDLTSESDRGAVLICASRVEQTLRLLFRHVAPDTMSKEELGKTLHEGGPLSTLYSLSNMAYLCRIIPRNTWSSIDGLRELRNKAAHSGSAFSIAKYEAELDAIYGLGPDISASLDRLAGQHAGQAADNQVLLDLLRSNAGDQPWLAKLMNMIAKRLDLPRIRRELQETNRPKLKLGLGTTVICSAIVSAGDRYLDILKQGEEAEIKRLVEQAGGADR